MRQCVQPSSERILIGDFGKDGGIARFSAILKLVVVSSIVRLSPPNTWV